MDKKKYILILTILILVVGGGILVWQKGWLSKIPFLQKIETANWKIYQNEEYGFEIKYPKNWGVSISSDISLTTGNQIFSLFVNNLSSKSTETSDGKIYQDRVVVSVESSPASYSLEEWIKIQENNPVEAKFGKIEDISAAGVPAVRGVFGCCMNYPETVFFVKDNSIFEIQGGNLGVSRTEHYNYENVFNQIVSTFGFIGTKGITNWKTYRNDNYGFEIKYPSDWYFGENNYGGQQMICFNPPRKQGDCDGLLTIDKNISLEDKYNQLKRLFPKNNIITGSIKVNSIPVKLSTIENSAGFSKSAIFENNNYIYNFEMIAGKEFLFNQMLTTFEFTGISKEQIQTGKINIDNNQISELQKAVDAGHQPWRLDIYMAASADIPQYGFTQDDLKTLQCPHIASNWVVGKDITGLWCEVSHDNQKYLVLVSQPQAGIGKIWMVSEIEKPPLNK